MMASREATADASKPIARLTQPNAGRKNERNVPPGQMYPSQRTSRVV